MKQTGETNPFITQSIAKELLYCSMPSVLSRLSSVFVDVVVTFFVAKLGIITLSAYGLAMPLYLTTFLIAGCFLMVFSVRANQLADELEQLTDYLRAALILAVGFSLVTMLLLRILPLLLPWLGQNVQMVSLVNHFFSVLMWVLPAQLINVIFGQLLIATKRGRITAVNSVVYVVVALLLVYSLTRYPWHFGLEGAAWGLVIASWIRLGLNYGYYLLVINQRARYRWPSFAVLVGHMKYLLILGAPLTLQFSNELLSGVVTTLMIGHMNAYAISVQQVANQARIFIVMIPFGIGQGCTVVVARYIKGRQLQTATNFITVLTRALMIGIIIMLPLLLWLTINPDSFIRLFFHASTSAAMLALARWFLYLTILALLVDLFKFSVAGLLRGAGNTSLSMICSIIGFWLIGIPGAAILGYGFHIGPLGVRIGMVSGLIVGTGLLITFFFKKIATEKQKG